MFDKTMSETSGTLGFFAPENDGYKEFMSKLNCSINLMWISKKENFGGSYICEEKHIPYISKQLQKWNKANPNMAINLWYDSQRSSNDAIINTKEILENLSPAIKLKDIREIPFVKDNSDFFLDGLALYYIIDFLKLIISLYEMETNGKTATIYTDLSIGDQVETVLGTDELFSNSIFLRLQKIGMILGDDSYKPENQFLQFINTPHLIQALKHSINSTLQIVSNSLNMALKYNNRNLSTIIQRTVFGATMSRLHTYLFVLKEQQSTLIRADVVNEGTNEQWVPYQPTKHQFILFGNFESAFNGTMYLLDVNDADSKTLRLPDIITLPKSIKSSLYAIDAFDYNAAVRKDLNPGHVGRDHGVWWEDIPKPSKGTFVPSYWSMNDKEPSLDEPNNPSSLNK